MHAKYNDLQLHIPHDDFDMLKISEVMKMQTLIAPALDAICYIWQKSLAN